MTIRIPAQRLGRAFWFAAGLLLASTAFFEFTSADLAVQDAIYDFEHHRWPVDGNNRAGRLVFYHGPKIVVIVLGAGLCGVLIGPRRYRERFGFDRTTLLVAVLTLVSVPVVVWLGKQLTRMHCPSELRRYGGYATYVTLCGESPDQDQSVPRGHCFPAGHASGGFSLLGLSWLRSTARWQNLVRTGAIAAGSVMGTYQMLKGAHFLSHTITTLLLSWIIAEAWRAWILPPAPDDML